MGLRFDVRGQPRALEQSLSLIRMLLSALNIGLRRSGRHLAPPSELKLRTLHTADHRGQSGTHSGKSRTFVKTKFAVLGEHHGKLMVVGLGIELTGLAAVAFGFGPTMRSVDAARTVGANGDTIWVSLRRR
jgi:hypothetical protein